MQVDYLDTPGVGDMDVTPMKVLTLIEQELLGTRVVGYFQFICLFPNFSPKRFTFRGCSLRKGKKNNGGKRLDALVTFWGRSVSLCISDAPNRFTCRSPC